MHSGAQIVRMESTLTVTKQDDGSFMVQRGTKLIGIADIKNGNLLTFRSRTILGGLFCSAIDLSPSELKSIGA